MLSFGFFLMRRRPPRSTLTDSLFPCTKLFRSGDDIPAALQCHLDDALPHRTTADDADHEVAGVGIDHLAFLPAPTGPSRPRCAGHLRATELTVNRSEEHTSDSSH